MAYMKYEVQTEDEKIKDRRRKELAKRYSKRVQGLSLFEFLVERPDLEERRRGKDSQR
jgi:hypothetical protein